MYAQDSIDLLQNSGIQFKKHEEEGIDPIDFAELLMTSGIVLMDNIKWLSFHSGYDFGYLLKVLTDQNLPADESEFFELLRIYFPTIYDVKYLMKSCKNLKGGLQEVAEQLELRRIGPQHQAGSDSLLTGMAFFKMREVSFPFSDRMNLQFIQIILALCKFLLEFQHRINQEGTPTTIFSYFQGLCTFCLRKNLQKYQLKCAVDENVRYIVTCVGQRP